LLSKVESQNNTTKASELANSHHDNTKQDAPIKAAVFFFKEYRHFPVPEKTMHNFVSYEVSHIDKSEQYEAGDVDVTNCDESVS